MKDKLRNMIFKSGKAQIRSIEVSGRDHEVMSTFDKAGQLV